MYKYTPHTYITHFYVYIVLSYAKYEYWVIHSSYSHLDNIFNKHECNDLHLCDNSESWTIPPRLKYIASEVVWEGEVLQFSIDVLECLS